MRVRMLSTQRGADDGVRLRVYQQGKEYPLPDTPRGLDLARAFIQEGWAEEVKPEPGLKVYRLPLKPEFIARGYTEDYEAFIAKRTAEARSRGMVVEVRDATPAEAAEGTAALKASLEAEAKLRAAMAEAPPAPEVPASPQDPAPPAEDPKPAPEIVAPPAPAALEPPAAIPVAEPTAAPEPGAAAAPAAPATEPAAQPRGDRSSRRRR